MKKITCFLYAVALVFALQSTAYAQGDISIGGGIAYGFDIEEIGIQLGGTYSLNEDMRLGVDIIYWLIGDDSLMGESFSYTFLEVNANFHYIFYNEDALMFYGIGTLGIHYADVSIDVMGFSGSESDTELGLGIGAGVEYDLGSVKLYAEPRFFLSGFDQFALSAGVRIPF